jgi:hypothetical protein
MLHHFCWTSSGSLVVDSLSQLNLFLNSSWNCCLISGTLFLHVSYRVEDVGFLPVLFSLSRILVMTRLWSEPTSAPQCARTSRTDLLKHPLMAIWSIWFLCWPLGEVHVYLCMSLCLSMVDVIAKLLIVKNAVSRSPLSLLSDFKP